MVNEFIHFTHSLSNELLSKIIWDGVMKNLKGFELDVSIENLMKTSKILAQWERLSGSDAEKEAFIFLQQELKNIGFSTTLIHHDAYISLPVAASIEIDGIEIPCQTHAMSPSVNRLEGELVYIKDESDSNLVTCNEKIVMIHAFPEFPLLEKLQNVGAKAVVFAQLELICESIVSDVWGSPSIYTKQCLPHIPCVSVTEGNAHRLKTFVGKKMRLSTAVDTGWRKIPLLIAELKAPTETDQFVMFTGHIDSWHYGAIDNATANATQLEVARIAALHKDELAFNFRIVYFSGHSHGRYAGSAWYADNNWDDLHYNCIININADCLGGVGLNDLTRSAIMPEAKPLAVSIIKKLTGTDYTGSRYGRFADQSFWIHGVSSAFASLSKEFPDKKQGLHDLGWWWHTSEDHIERIDPENLLRDARIFTLYAMTFLTSPRILLDFRQTVAELLKGLMFWQEKARNKFDLSLELAIARELDKNCEALYRMQISDKCFNRLALELGRILIPLNMTTGNIYKNDSCAYLPPVPSLCLIDEMVSAIAGSDLEKEILVELVQKRNYVRHSLIRANTLITCTLAIQL